MQISSQKASACSNSRVDCRWRLPTTAHACSELFCGCRYGPGDKVEAWLNDLLCLNAAEHIPKPPPQLPHPSDCELYFVERDTLFSYHKVST